MGPIIAEVNSLITIAWAAGKGKEPWLSLLRFGHSCVKGGIIFTPRIVELLAIQGVVPRIMHY